MVTRSPLPRVSRRGRITLIVLGVVLVVFTLLDRFVTIWTDWLWFGEVGYRDVFTGVLRTRILLFLIFGLAMAAFIAANLYLAYRTRPLPRMLSPEQQALERYRMLLSPRIGLWVGLLAAIVGFFGGLSGQGHWSEWLLFTNSQEFGVTDPQFNVDAGFYVFEYPFWRYLLDVGFTMTALAIIGSLAVHYLYGGVRLQGAGDRMTNAARAHLSGLIALFVILKAVAYFLDRRGLLLGQNSGTGLSGAGYTDINALLPAKEMLAYISILVAIAIIVFSNARFRNLLWAGASLALLAIAAIAVGGIYPAVVQQFTVKPNIPEKEAPYIKNTIDATRTAYGLDAIVRERYELRTTEPPATLNTDKTVVPTIRLLDPAVVGEAFTQSQQPRAFYDFNDKLDIDRYGSGTTVQDYVVGVREINYSKLVDQQLNWQNRHTYYTHGYGFVAAPANQICGGGPQFVSGFLGSESTGRCAGRDNRITATEQRVYYGELAQPDDYAVVGKSNGEFDRPSGDKDLTTTYDGKGGVGVGSFGRRLLYALYFKEGNFLLANVFNDSSKVLYVRNPRDRVEKVAPFLTLDGDPYPAVVNGRVTWILDAYTTSATYPYSQRVDLRDATDDSITGTGTFVQNRQDVNYIRNSVKATVDAYDGTVTLYAFDKTDPILKAWRAAFGNDIIKDDIPAELREHFRYPEDLFKVQRDLLSRFHVTDPREFNSGAAFWAVPDDPAKPDLRRKQPPYYLLTQMPNQNEKQFQLTATLTPRDRQNLAAIISASYVDGQPKLNLQEVSGAEQVDGPGLAYQRMTNGDPDARQRITLLKGTDNQIVYGNLLSLPFQNGILYVQPVYLRSTTVQNPFPQLQLVVVSYGAKVAYADNLTGAISALVAKAGGPDSPTGTPPGGGNTPGTTSPTSAPPTSAAPTTPPVSGNALAAAQRIEKAFADLQAAQASGDWAKQGQAMAELQAATKEFIALTGATPSPGG